MWAQSRGCGSSHVGGRTGNQDHYVLDPKLGLFIVADGMGGRAGGGVASRIATRVVHRFFEHAGSDSDLGFGTSDTGGPTIAEGRMNMALRLAHREVRRQAVGALDGMGSTLSVLLLRHGHALIAHVGDSRVYRWREGVFQRMTVDHSFHAKLLEAGVANVSPDRSSCRFGHLVTRAVGMPGEFKPEVQRGTVRPGDRFLLCSDGLTDTVDETTIETVLASLPAEQAAPMLVATALGFEARDNVTAVVVEAYLPKI